MAATLCVPMAEWECFGDDDDDEDEDDDGARTRTLGVPTPLVLAPQPCEPVAIPPCPPSRQPELWADHPPLYMGPMRVVSGLDDVGNGRGFAATDDLAAGTLLLVEQPFLPFIRRLNDDGDAIVDDGADEGAPRPTPREMPTNDDIADISFAYVRENGGAVPPPIELVHPVSPIDSVPADEVIEARNRVAASYVNGTIGESGDDDDDARAAVEDAATRLLLVLERSSFASGLYLHASIFNHSADAPACKRVRPDGASEVWLTRDVQKDETLTICYTAPIDLCSSARHAVFARQHGFMPAPPSSDAFDVVVVEDSSNDDSAHDAEAGLGGNGGDGQRKAALERVDSIDAALDELDGRLALVRTAMASAPPLPHGERELECAAAEVAQIFAAAGALFEHDIESTLGPRHCLRRRAAFILATSASLCIDHGGPRRFEWRSHADGENQSGVPPKCRAAAAAFSWALRALRATDECAWLGRLHPDAGDAAAIASRALQQLLSTCAHRILVSAFSDPLCKTWHDQHEVSACERSLRQRSAHIAELYDSARFCI